MSCFAGALENFMQYYSELPRIPMPLLLSRELVRKVNTKQNNGMRLIVGALFISSLVPSGFIHTLEFYSALHFLRQRRYVLAIEKIESISRRKALAMLGMTGAFGLVGYDNSGSHKTKMRNPAPAGGMRGGGKRSVLKTIGVLGGLGPQATMDFEARVHQVAQRLLPQHQNSGYPPMVVYYYRHPPILLQDDYSPRLPIQPDPRLLEAARRMGALVDFMVITSNGPHMLQEQIERAAGCKILSMIEVTLKDLLQRQWRRVGVLGFGDPMVYTKPLGELNIACETIDGELRAKLDRAIMKVMEGRDDAESAAMAREAVTFLRARKVEGIILGCTEIPLLLREDANAPDLVNPAQLLAEAAVKHAMVEE
jgi:aspartate racemase